MRTARELDMNERLAQSRYMRALEAERDKLEHDVYRYRAVACVMTAFSTALSIAVAGVWIAVMFGFVT